MVEEKLTELRGSAVEGKVNYGRDLGSAWGEQSLGGETNKTNQAGAVRSGIKSGQEEMEPFLDL